jgi:AcrR family transcriptional regulator
MSNELGASWMAARREGRGCPRPYTLGKRKESADKNRTRVLEAAEYLLANEGMAEFSMDAVAREVGVTRQTIHNQFGTRSELIEELFDQMALRGGIAQMATAMTQTDPVQMLQRFVGVFGQFWSSQRVAIRRIRALATLDPELDRIVRARNERRRLAATRVVDLLCKRFGKPLPAERARAVDFLFAITSFEFFDSFVGNQRPAQACDFIVRVVMRTLEIRE